MATDIEITPRTQAIGADVAGVDLRAPLSDEAAAVIQSALDEHMVLFLGEQDVAPAVQRAFAARFGSIERHPFARHLDDPPDVGLLDQTEPKRDGANRWHMDSTFMPKPPSLLLLRAVKLPDAALARGAHTTNLRRSPELHASRASTRAISA